MVDLSPMKWFIACAALGALAPSSALAEPSSLPPGSVGVAYGSGDLRIVFPLRRVRAPGSTGPIAIDGDLVVFDEQGPLSRVTGARTMGAIKSAPS